jgi:hypothetical protein
MHIIQNDFLFFRFNDSNNMSLLRITQIYLDNCAEIESIDDINNDTNDWEELSSIAFEIGYTKFTIMFGQLESLIESIDKNENMREYDGGNSSSSYGVENGEFVFENEVSGNGGDSQVTIRVPICDIDKDSLELLRAVVKKIRANQ